MPKVLYPHIFARFLLFLICIQSSNAAPSVAGRADALRDTTVPTKTLVKRPTHAHVSRICDNMYGSPNFWDCDKALLLIPTPNAQEAVRYRQFRGPDAEEATDMPNEKLPQIWRYDTCIIEIATLSNGQRDMTWDTASWRSLRGVSRQINNYCVWGKGSGGMQKVGLNGRLSSTVYSSESELAVNGGVDAVRQTFGSTSAIDAFLDVISGMLTTGSAGESRSEMMNAVIEEVVEPSAPPLEQCAASYCVPGLGGDCCQGWSCAWNDVVNVAATTLMLGSKGLGGVAEVGWCSAVS
ncbi:MAG: hypothetical protein M1835_006864 [Candelina submexicana]|nr:MAG: hypothetical protein M1835_006864 [Candelina submexicana]